MERKLTQFQQHCERWKDGCGSHICHLPGVNRVFYRGDIPCDICFIGEAPGESENQHRVPFYGPAGALLDTWVDDSIGEENRLRDKLRMKRITHGYTNLTACIPYDSTGRKTEKPDSGCIKLCSPRLKEIVRICKPRIIILVGTLAKKHVVGQAQFCNDDEGTQPPWIPEGEYLEFAEIIHPAFFLRSDMPQAQKASQMQFCIVTIQRMIRKFLK